MPQQNIEIPSDKIAVFCAANHIQRLALFGSVLDDNFTSESDVDMLVEFVPGNVPGLISLAGIERQLSEIISRKVDLRTLDDLSRYFRDAVREQAEIVYEQR